MYEVDIGNIQRMLTISTADLYAVHLRLATKNPHGRAFRNNTVTSHQFNGSEFIETSAVNSTAHSGCR